MHTNLDLILTLTGGLAAALALGYLTQRLGLSPIVGYLLAGVAVGPNTPGFVANHELAEQCAEIGVILLMFGVGLHFHYNDLHTPTGHIAVGWLIVEDLFTIFVLVLLPVVFGGQPGGGETAGAGGIA